MYDNESSPMNASCLVCVACIISFCCLLSAEKCSLLLPMPPLSFHDIPKSEQDAVRKAFDVLAVQQAADAVVSEVALPHLCRVMNLCVNEEDLYQICISLGRGSSEGGRTPHAAAAPHILPPTEFTFDAIKRVYDAFAPKQGDHVRLYFQLFNLLDVNEVGRISQADLRHCMCSTGDRLSDDEFHHLLYANDLLHKPEITVFEFVRLLLRVPLANCAVEAPVGVAAPPHQFPL